MISVKLLSNDRLQLKFHYNRQIIDIIKDIPGWEWNSEEKYWSIPRSQVHALERLFPESLAWLTPPYIIKGEEPDLPTHSDIELLDKIEGFKLELYPFQKVGASFLVQKGSALLCDDMGLGKTPQAIAAALELYNRGEISSVLVICPSSVKRQWGDQIEKFVDREHIDKELYAIIDGTADERKKQYKAAKDAFMVVINYDLLYNDIKEIKKLSSDMVVLDEAHYIKNRTAKRTKKVRQIKAPYRVCLTGTPMQNRPDELFSLVDYVRPGYLGNWSDFVKEYVVYDYSQGYPILQGYTNFEQLHRLISPIMMRRLKDDVAMELPQVIQQNLYVKSTPQQLRLYKQIEDEKIELRKRIDELRKGPQTDKTRELIELFDATLQGKNALAIGSADSPQLLKMSHSKAVRNGYKITDISSPKLKELYRIVQEFVQDDYKVVIFTQFARMLSLIEKDLSQITRCATIFGAKSADERDAAVKQFYEDPFTHVLILTDAGCEGLNLQFAKALINVDLPWNPAILDQRIGRIHRIGSTYESVNVINLIAEGSIDEQILNTIQNKRDMFEAIVENTEAQRAALAELMREAK